MSARAYKGGTTGLSLSMKTHEALTIDGSCEKKKRVVIRKKSRTSSNISITCKSHLIWGHLSFFSAVSMIKVISLCARTYWGGLVPGEHWIRCRNRFGLIQYCIENEFFSFQASLCSTLYPHDLKVLRKRNGSPLELCISTSFVFAYFCHFVLETSVRVGACVTSFGLLLSGK